MLPPFASSDRPARPSFASSARRRGLSRDGPPPPFASSARPRGILKERPGRPLFAMSIRLSLVVLDGRASAPSQRRALAVLHAGLAASPFLPDIVLSSRIRAAPSRCPFRDVSSRHLRRPSLLVVLSNASVSVSPSSCSRLFGVEVQSVPTLVPRIYLSKGVKN